MSKFKKEVLKELEINKITFNVIQEKIRIQAEVMDGLKEMIMCEHEFYIEEKVLETGEKSKCTCTTGEYEIDSDGQMWAIDEYFLFYKKCKHCGYKTRATRKDYLAYKLLKKKEKLKLLNTYLKENNEGKDSILKEIKEVKKEIKDLEAKNV